MRFSEADVDVDVNSLHLDDFLGVPWPDFANASSPSLPASFVARWTSLRDARRPGVPAYLSLSPLGQRRTLARRLEPSGATTDHWAPVDADGCYPFASDANAALWQTAP